MSNSYLRFPEFDPVLFSIGPVSLHWYGLMYLVGFVFAMWLAIRRANKPGSGWTLRTRSICSKSGTAACRSTAA